MPGQLFLVTGIMSVDGKFRNNLFEDPDRTLREAGISLAPVERTELKRILDKGGNDLKEALQRGQKFFCPVPKSCPWPSWPYECPPEKGTSS